MKKRIAVLLAVLIVICAGCKNKTTKTDPTVATEQQIVETAPEVTEQVQTKSAEEAKNTTEANTVANSISQAEDSAIESQIPGTESAMPTENYAQQETQNSNVTFPTEEPNAGTVFEGTGTGGGAGL